MSRIKNKWIEKQTNEKVLSILGLICALSIIVLAILQLSGIFDTLNIIYLLISILMLIQTIKYWKKHKPVAILSLIAAIFNFLNIL